MAVAITWSDGALKTSSKGNAQPLPHAQVHAKHPLKMWNEKGEKKISIYTQRFMNSYARALLMRKAVISSNLCCMDK